MENWQLWTPSDSKQRKYYSVLAFVLAVTALTSDHVLPSLAESKENTNRPLHMS